MDKETGAYTHSGILRSSKDRGNPEVTVTWRKRRAHAEQMKPEVQAKGQDDLIHLW